MPLLEVPDVRLIVEPGNIVVSKGGEALWARIAGAPGSAGRGPIYYKGNEISSWAPARRRAAGILALFGRPHAPRGMTLPELIRISGGAAGARSLLRARAAEMGLPAGILEKPLDDDAWDAYGSEAEWLQAGVTSPELVVACGARPAGAAIDCAAVLL